jgi:hypothetical protein
MLGVHMRVFVTCVAVVLASFARPGFAQDPPPPIPWFAVDLHATVPQFPSDDPLLALSRGMNVAELPGSGLGAQVGVHMYPLRLHAVTFGVGGELAIGRARQTPLTAPTTASNVTGLRPAEARFASLSPQLSLNFGNGSGWSYLSAGLGQATWSIEPEGLTDYPPNSDPVKTVNFGGGGRWFIKRHVAFSFDVRFYAINPGAVGINPGTGEVYPGMPRTRLLIIGAGISLK